MTADLRPGPIATVGEEAIGGGVAVGGGLAAAGAQARPRERRYRAATAGIVFAVASLAANLSQVGFHLAAAGLLGPAEYGALGALVAVMAALALPATAVQTVVTARVARRMQRGTRFDPTPAMRMSLAFGCAAGAMLLAASPLLGSYIHLAGGWPVVLVAASCVPLAAGVVAGGVLCGQRRFAVVGAIGLAGAVLKIVFAVLLIGAGFGVAGALAGSLVADCLRVGLLWWTASRTTSTWRGAPALRLRLRPATAGASSMTALQLVLIVDAVLARHYLVASQAGLYVAATTAARTIVFAIQIGCTLVLPRFAVGRGDQPAQALRSTLLASAALGVGAAVALSVLGPTVLPLLIGAEYSFSSRLLLLRASAAVVVGLVGVVLQFRLTRTRSVRPAAAWLGVGLVVAAGMLYHSSAASLALATSVAVGLLCLPMMRTARRPGSAVPAAGAP